MPPGDDDECHAAGDHRIDGHLTQDVDEIGGREKMGRRKRHRDNENEKDDQNAVIGEEAAGAGRDSATHAARPRPDAWCMTSSCVVDLVGKFGDEIALVHHVNPVAHGHQLRQVGGNEDHAPSVGT